MFATKLLLKYAVKPISPPRNVLPQETTRTFTYLPYQRDYPIAYNYSTAYMSKHVSRSSVPDYDAIRAMRLQHHNKLCATSEPKPINRRKWTDFEESIVNHPNFEKAAALVQMLDDGTLQKPHRIGSLPSGKAPFTSDAKTIKAAVNIVKNVIGAQESEGEAELQKQEEEEMQPEEKARQTQVNSRGDTRVPQQTKPYVINIYLDTKQTRTIRDDDLKRKIKEFWDEQMLQNNPRATTARNVAAEEVTSDEEEFFEIPEEDRQRYPYKTEKRSPQRRQQLATHQEEFEDKENLEDVPRYQPQHITKMYPDPTSTANPHTNRLLAGSPANYDINKKIKEVITSVNPVNASGFTKYLTFWKQMWNRKQESKETQAMEKDEEHEEYNNENPEDEQAKQAFKLIEHDEIFSTKEKKYNPYDPKRKQDEITRETTRFEEAPDVERGNRQKRKYGSQRRYYSTVTNPKALNGLILGPDESLRAKSRATTRLQIMEFQNIEDQLLNYPQKMDYSTSFNKYGYFKSDPKDSSSAGSKLSKKTSKPNQTRVEEFVDKFKNALSVDNGGGFKKISVVYGKQDRNLCANPSREQRQVKVKISKIIDSKSECQIGQNRNGDNIRKPGDKYDRKSHSAKKK